MKTARLLKKRDSFSKNGWVFRDVRISDGSILTRMGYSVPNQDGKFEALWDLAQRLSERGIEVEAA